VAYPKYGGGIKPRWFICLGFTDQFAQVSSIYLSTTTTQIEHFRQHGQRGGHAHFLFRAEEIQVFEQDCIIDFFERPYSIDKTKIDEHSGDIEIKGSLDEQRMRMIYNKYLVSKNTSPMEMLDIHNSYNLQGIEGLKRPKIK